LTNARFQSAKAAGYRCHGIQLQFKWAFAFPSAASVYGQPTIVDGRVFASADSGYVYSLDATTGCVHWSFQAQSGVASAITIAKRPGTSTQFAAYFGDIRGNVMPWTRRMASCSGKLRLILTRYRAYEVHQVL